MATLPLKIVAISASADERFYRDLKEHLGILKRAGQITLWHDSLTPPAFDILQERKRHLDAAGLVLLLLSPDFMASADCQAQLVDVLCRKEAGSLLVLPIIVRPVGVDQTPLTTIKKLPSGGRAITTWADIDEAYVDIVRGIRNLMSTLTAD